MSEDIGKRPLQWWQKGAAIVGIILGGAALVVLFQGHISIGSSRPAEQIAPLPPTAGAPFHPAAFNPVIAPQDIPQQRLVVPTQSVPPPLPETDKGIASPIMGFNSGQANQPVRPVAERREDEGDLTGANGGDELATRLRATPIKPTMAQRLRHPEMIITEGTQIPCTQQTAIDTSFAGFVSAIIPQDIRGSTGDVVLLDAGTKLFGQIDHGTINGLSRAFVLWRSATTPSGIRIQVNSPAADEVGRNGLDGDLDRHEWQKIKGVLLMSLIQGGIQAGVAAASSQHSGVGFYQFQSGGDQVANTLLGSTIQIPDVLSRRQGLACTVFVAHDMDFSAVYRLRTAN